LFLIGESNFSDHGANRLGASALMQGLADGCSSLYYRRLFITRHKKGPISTDSPEFEAAEKELKSRLKIHEQQRNTFCWLFPQETRKIMWDKVGMARMLRD
jgi:succinate dehydrogenase / fumarate reductase flavoprotein subunit